MPQPSKSAERSYLNRIIAGAELFRAAPPDDIAEIARNARLTAIPRGKSVAPPKGKGGEVFIIETGAVAALEHDPIADKAVLIALYGPGSVAGLGAVASGLSGGAVEVSHRELRALSNVTVVAIGTADFLRVVRRSPELTEAFIGALGRELGELAARMTASLGAPLETRLAGFFADLARILSGNAWEPTVNIGRLQQTQVADMLGVSREHVNRTLIMWERSGLILQTKGGDVVIENRKRLDQIARARRIADGASIENEWIWEIQSHLGHGLNDSAFDLAMEGVKRAPRDDRFKYFAALAMARMGALKEALSLVESFKLTTDASNEDIASIGPRLRRDLAFASTPADMALLAEAAEGYDKVFQALKSTYPGVNAASTYAMIGDDARAKKLAREVGALAAAALDDIDEDDPSYWTRATLAECRLIEGDLAGAAAGYLAAVKAPDAAPGMIGTTRKQLKRLKSRRPIDDGWIDSAAPQAGVVYFCGPLTPAGVSASRQLERLRQRIDATLEERPLAAGVGALAAGADIAIAEALLDAGVKLHVHLPVEPAEFVATSVDPFGDHWRERYIACVERAQTIDWTRRTGRSRGAYRLGSRIGMGRVIRLAEEIDGKPYGFFALQRGRTPENSVSCENAAIWRLLGHHADIVEDDWQAVAARADAGRANDYFAALVVAGAAAPATLNEGKAQFTAMSGSIACFAFENAIEAIDAARRVAASAEAKTSRLWLDIGAVDEAATDKFPSALITAASRPLTAPGKTFASEGFVNAAIATPGCPRPFEYAGVTSTEEKLDPCPLYLVTL